MLPGNVNIVNILGVNFVKESVYFKPITSKASRSSTKNNPNSYCIHEENLVNLQHSIINLGFIKILYKFFKVTFEGILSDSIADPIKVISFKSRKNMKVEIVKFAICSSILH